MGPPGSHRRGYRRFTDGASAAYSLAAGVPDPQVSAKAKALLPSQPPMTRTRPSARRVAVWSSCASASVPARENLPVAGSHTSAEARKPSPPQPPTTRTRPSGRRVAVWYAACLGERACRAERCRGRVPDLRRGEASSRPCPTPPTTRTRPSGRSVAVWRARASASEPAGREGRRGRVPDLRRGEGERGRVPAARRRGRGHRAGAWRCGTRVPRRASLPG